MKGVSVMSLGKLAYSLAERHTNPLLFTVFELLVMFVTLKPLMLSDSDSDKSSADFYKLSAVKSICQITDCRK